MHNTSHEITTDDDHKIHSFNDKPAIVYPNSLYWYKHGLLHRENNPAIIIVHYIDNGKEFKTKKWYKDGKLHNRKGPAIILINGNKEWWIEDYLFKIEINGKIYYKHTIPCKSCMIRPVCDFSVCKLNIEFERYGEKWYGKYKHNLRISKEI